MQQLGAILGNEIIVEGDLSHLKELFYIFFSISVIKVVKKLINQKTRENRWIFKNHF